MGKRILSIIMATAFLLSFAPSSFAESDDNTAGEYIEEVADDTQSSNEEVYESEETIDSPSEVYDEGIQLFSNFTQRTTKPDKNSVYYGSGNPLSGSYGWCTWYAWGRAYEILGSRPYLSVHGAGTWFDETTAYPKTKGNYYAAKVGAVACYENHVAIVEAVAANGAPAALSEGGYQSGNSSTYLTTRWSSHHNHNINLYFHYGPDYIDSPFIGYIYLLDSASGGGSTQVHSHSWTTGNESAHPHRQYRKCTSCGASEYTGATQLWQNCSSCYPIGNVSLTRSFNRTGKTAEFYRNNVMNTNSYTLTLYLNNRYYGEYSMPSSSYYINYLQSGTYYAVLTAKNTNTGQTRTASCTSFTIVDSYKVTYNANGGTNAPAAQTKIKDENMTITSSIPKKVGHIFKGWASSKTAIEPQYYSGGTYTKNTPITLYAVWEPETYMINFDTNDGQGEVPSVTITYGDSMRMPNSIVKENCYLKGWSKTKNSSSADYKIGMDYKLTENMTLYAVWGNSTWGGTVATKFAGGDGTKKNPYQISNAAELAYLANQVNQQNAAPDYKYYILTDNINLGGEQWLPIGLYDNSSQYFYGSFDGDGYTISGLSISEATTSHIGLFGYTKDSEVKNLTISGDITSISTDSTVNIGIIAGSAENTKIDGCSALYVNVSNISASTSTNDESYVGCVVGNMNGGKINNVKTDECYINLKSGEFTSGIVAGRADADITDCSVKAADGLFSTSASAGNMVLGGLCGSLKQKAEKCTVEAGYFSNTIKSEKATTVGGIAGSLTGKVKLCTVNFNSDMQKNIDGASYPSSIYSASKQAHTGGIAGGMSGTASVSDCKYDGKSISSIASSFFARTGGLVGYANMTGAPSINVTGGEPVRRAELPKRSGYKATWYTDADLTKEYDFSQPVTGDLTLYAKWTEGEDKVEIWDGTSSEPEYNSETKTYTVRNGRELAWISDVTNGVITSGKNFPEDISFQGYTVELANDIYLNDTTNWENWNTTAPKNEWKPIELFEGTFSGNNYGIYGIYSKEERESTGFIRYLSTNGVIKNITTKYGYISGGTDYTGGIAGYNYQGEIINCKNNITILGDKKVGGIIGYSDSGKISNCTNAGKITGMKDYFMGGLIGQSEHSQIYNCNNMGYVKGGSMAGGGIVGSSSDDVIKECYNIGEIYVSGTGISYAAGGITGIQNKTSVSLCHNLGHVSAPYSSGNYVNEAGGITGENQSSSISYCYNSGNGGIAGTLTYNGNTAYIRSCYSTQTPLYNWESNYTSNYYTLTNVSYKSASAMKNLSNLTGFSTNDWAVDTSINNGYPYLKALEQTYRTYKVTTIENPADSAAISRSFSHVDGILYSNAEIGYTNSGGILGAGVSAEKAEARNLLSVADRISAAGNATGTGAVITSGDIVGMNFDEMFQFSNTASNDVDLSAVSAKDKKYAATNQTADSVRSLSQIKRKSFLTNIFGPNTYQSLSNLAEHPDAVWVVKDGEFPDLYYNLLNDVTLSEVENGVISVDKTQAIDGEIVTVTATPSEGYQLNKIYVNGEEIDGATFEVAGDSNVYATFAEKTPEYTAKVTTSSNADAHLVNVDAEQTGRVSLMSASDSLSALDGEEIRVDTEASADYTVDAVYVNGESLAGDSFIITENSTITMDVTSISTEVKAMTHDAENIGNTFATLGGSVEGDGDTVRYVRYWAADNPSEVYTTEVESGAGEYSVEVTNLVPQKTYYYQMTETGEIKSFVAEGNFVPLPDEGDEPIDPPTPPVEEDMIKFEIQNAGINNGIISASVVNISEETQSELVILASYTDDGIFVSADSREVDSLASNASLPCGFAAPSGASKYKLFVWDSYSGMRPLSEVAEI